MSKDTIYRQAAIDSLTEYGNGRAVYISVEEAVRRIEQLPSAQPDLQPTCNQLATDTISRQAAIDAVETKIKKWNAVDGEGYHVGLGLRYTDVIDTLTELPSAQPDVPDRNVGDIRRQPGIVHCKSCKWYKTNYSWNGKEHKVCVIEPYEPIREGDDFCSRAERRTDE